MLRVIFQLKAFVLDALSALSQPPALSCITQTGSKNVNVSAAHKKQPWFQFDHHAFYIYLRLWFGSQTVNCIKCWMNRINVGTINQQQSR